MQLYFGIIHAYRWGFLLPSYLYDAIQAVGEGGYFVVKRA